MPLQRFKTYTLPTLLLFLTFFISCHKVIDVSLNNAATQIVITGEVNNQPGPYAVSISQTVNYSVNNVFPPVTGALVIISGNSVTDTLSEITPGTYLTHTLQGVEDSSYQLTVVVQGQEYKSVSTMPEQVPLDSIGSITGFSPGTLNAVAYFQDPPGVANYYQFIEFNDGKPFPDSRGWSTFDDRLSDGRYITNVIFDDSTDYKIGDTLSVQMNCVDKNVDNYLFTLSEITSNATFGSPAPANPISNITNNALGYFSANTKQVKSIVVK